MSLGDAVLTFLSVLVAALLAFYLDGLRERRATQRWVREQMCGYATHMTGIRDELARRDSEPGDADGARMPTPARLTGIGASAG